MNKTVEDALNELIEFYSITDINDLQYLKKLFVRNLKDVRRRWIKYDKPIREENKQLKSILTDLEEWCNDGIKDELVKFDYGTELIGEPIKIHITSYEMILNKMQELEQGSEINEKS